MDPAVPLVKVAAEKLPEDICIDPEGNVEMDSLPDPAPDESPESLAAPEIDREDDDGIELKAPLFELTEDDAAELLVAPEIDPVKDAGSESVIDVVKEPAVDPGKDGVPGKPTSSGFSPVEPDADPVDGPPTDPVAEPLNDEEPEKPASSDVDPAEDDGAEVAGPSDIDPVPDGGSDDGSGAGLAEGGTTEVPGVSELEPVDGVAEELVGGGAMDPVVGDGGAEVTGLSDIGPAPDDDPEPDNDVMMGPGAGLVEGDMTEVPEASELEPVDGVAEELVGGGIVGVLVGCSVVGSGDG